MLGESAVETAPKTGPQGIVPAGHKIPRLFPDIDLQRFSPFTNHLLNVMAASRRKQRTHDAGLLEGRERS